MKRAKRMQALAQQRYERQIIKGLDQADRGQVVSHEEAMKQLDMHMAIIEARHASGAMLFKRRARSWWMPNLADLEEDESEE